MAFFRRHTANINLGQAFRDNRQLQQFVLTDVTPTGRILGTGSFGSVEEVWIVNTCMTPTLKQLSFSVGHVQTSGLCWQENA